MDSSDTLRKAQLGEAEGPPLSRGELCEGLLRVSCSWGGNEGQGILGPTPAWPALHTQPGARAASSLEQG